MSKIVKIISKKVITQNLYGVFHIKLNDYVNNLYETAKNQPGFIKSNSYWEFEINHTGANCNSIETLSISEWKSIKDWDNWYTSKERLNIYNNYKDLDRTEKFSILKKRTLIDNVFLL
jgi:hypothetical protein